MCVVMVSIGIFPEKRTKKAEHVLRFLVLVGVYVALAHTQVIPAPRQNKNKKT